MQLEPSKPLLESILNSVASGIVVADQNGNFLLYNPAAERIFGLGATVAKPADWSKLYGFFGADGVTPLAEDELPLVRAMRGESVTGMRVFIKNDKIPEGAWLNLNATPLLDAEGKIQGGVIAFDDITQQHDLEVAINRSNADLEQFASIAAHDLQEPLRTIVSFINLLEQRNKDTLDEKSHRYMNNVVFGAKRMQVLINDLLAYSRIRTKGQPFAPVEMQSVVKEALTDLSEVIEQSSTDVTVEPLPVVMGDASQLKHLVLNLVSNAIKFRTEEPPKIHIGVRPSIRFGMVRFFVEDNGIGIDPKFHKRIFAIFQRLHSMDSYPGTGIGLAICKQIVERHNGEISVESEEGKGATFYFSLPEGKPQ